ncbi:nmrA-family protein [Pluteus cervinus]|uniref:NmrA-family protein n=1 Tax=Pluteus cervinus TaxID=181527 RepID=A0ACD3B9P9_9AGAR|nr:nmrA-family protein [Pluteus cervinus]
MNSRTPKKLILVIGATGAQGMAIIPALLAPSEDGTPSPFAIRALTRNPTSRRARELEALGVELFKGAFDNLPSLAKAFEGCYGAFVNTDTYTVGEEREIYAGIKIYEAARRTNTMRHLVWSNLDYGSKLGNYNPIYKTEHHDAKGIVQEFLKGQPSSKDVDGLAWTSVTSGVYMEMLNYPLCGPLNKRQDGTVIFASPIGDGCMPMIALSDLGWWVRYTLDHRRETSGRDLQIASDMVGWDYLVETFTRVTGQPAIHKRLTLDEWFACLDGVHRPVANEKQAGDGSTTVQESFSGFWSLWRDSLVKRDLEWIRSVHPKGYTIESWMRANRYSGRIGSTALKNAEDGKGRLLPNKAVTITL